MDYRQLAMGLVLGLMLGAGVSTVIAQDQQNERPEVVMREGLAPTRAAPNGEAQITLLAEGEKAFMGKLRVKPGAELPEHQDDSEEYLYVLKGKGKLTIDGTEYQAKPQSGIFIPAGSKVTFENGDRVFEALQFFAPTDSANKYSKWETGKVPMKDKSRGGNRRGRGTMAPGGGR